MAAIKTTYIPNFLKMEIVNVELDTDGETYCDVNVNVNENDFLVPAVTYEYGNDFKKAKKMAQNLAKRYNAEYVEADNFYLWYEEDAN